MVHADHIGQSPEMQDPYLPGFIDEGANDVAVRPPVTAHLPLSLYQDAPMITMPKMK
jgi:hypothetical protein